MSGPMTPIQAGEKPQLRLGSRERVLDACARLPLVLEAMLGTPTEADIVTTWRDWPGDDTGSDTGLVVEVERTSGGVVQTVRGAMPEGRALDMSIDLGGDKFGVPLRTDLQLAEAGKILPDDPSRLRLRSDMKRRRIPLRWRESCLTLTLETGRVLAWPEDGRFLSRRVALGSLRLDRGDRADLEDFALLLSREGGLGPLDQTPEQVGRALLREDFGEPVRAPRYQLSADMTAADVFERAIGAAITQILGNIPALRAGRAGGIKQMRVGLRRLRALIRTFNRDLKDPELEGIVSEAKRFGGILGEARDLDVFLDETLPAIIDTGLPQAEELSALEVMRVEAEKRRRDKRAAVISMIDGDDQGFAHFAMRLTLLQEHPLSDAQRDTLSVPAGAYAGKALKRRHKKVRQTAESLAGAAPHARHPLRVELKKLRYAVHAFRPLYGKGRRKPFMAEMSTLQDSFGALNDAVVARQTAADVARYADFDADKMALEAATGYIAGWTQRGLSGQADLVLDAWHDFAEMKPFWKGGA